MFGHIAPRMPVRRFVAPYTDNFGMGTANERFGLGAGNDMASGTQNSLFGAVCATGLSTGSSNTIVGWQTATGLATGSLNVIVGAGSAANLDVGSSNMIMGGSNAGTLHSGSFNVVIGASSDVAAMDTAAGVAVGVGAITGSNAVALGNTANAASNAIALGVSSLAAANEFAVSPNINFQTWYGISSTNATRQRAQILVGWLDNTDAIRRAFVQHSVADTVQQTYLTAITDGSGASVQFFNTATGIGGGRNVVSISDALVAPSSNPTGGGIAYSASGQLNWRGPTGAAVNLVQEAAERSWMGI